MATPIVSFIISVYNGESFLKECIDGINNQTFSDYEVIVVDDGSSDNTPEILSDWRKQNGRVQIITRTNGGLTSALNLAISKSKGKYLSRHDADDISSLYRLEQQVAFLDSNQNAVLTGSHCVEFADEQSLIALYCPPDDSRLILETLRKGENPLVHGSIMFRKSAFERLPEGYRFRYGQDYDLYLRISSFGDLRIVPGVLYGLRNHPSRIGIQSRELKRRIHTLCMQVNGLVPWDSKSKIIIENYRANKPLWRVLQERIIQSTPVTSEDKMKAQYYMSMIGDNLERNKKFVAFVCALKAIGVCPSWGKTWLSLPYAFIGIAIPCSIISRWRGRSIMSRYRKPCYAASLNEIFAK